MGREWSRMYATALITVCLLSVRPSAFAREEGQKVYLHAGTLDIEAQQTRYIIKSKLPSVFACTFCRCNLRELDVTLLARIDRGRILHVKRVHQSLRIPSCRASGSMGYSQNGDVGRVFEPADKKWQLKTRLEVSSGTYFVLLLR